MKIPTWDEKILPSGNWGTKDNPGTTIANVRVLSVKENLKGGISKTKSGRLLDIHHFNFAQLSQLFCLVIGTFVGLFSQFLH